MQLLEAELNGGLPRVLEPALRFMVSGEVTPEVASVRDRVEAVRRTLPRVVMSYAPASDREPDLPARASVDSRWGTFLHLCAVASEAQTILELGTAAGISGCYLAQSTACKKFYGLDGAAERLELAKKSFAACGVEKKVQLLLGDIDETLPRVLEQESAFDLVWIDADHHKAPTLRYFEAIVPRLREGSLVLFDDIHYPPRMREMREAWDELRARPGFAHTVDAGRIGAGIWAGDGRSPRFWDMRPALTWPRRPYGGG